MPDTTILSHSEVDRKTVIQRELEWHENEAERRYSLDNFLYRSPAFDAIVNSTFSFLQMQPGERILDIGGGEGKETIQLAQSGLDVISIDLSHVQLSRAFDKVKQEYPELNVHFVQANAEELPFASGSFRVIHGKAIIHHLDIHLAAAEIKRLLQANGRAVFSEPMAYHPLIWLGRRFTPRLRTQDEHPLTFDELHQFAESFEQWEIEKIYLLAPLAYPWRLLPKGERLFRWLYARLQRLDAWLLPRLPQQIQRLSWYAIAKVNQCDAEAPFRR